MNLRERLRSMQGSAAPSADVAPAGPPLPAADVGGPAPGAAPAADAVPTPARAARGTVTPPPPAHRGLELLLPGEERQTTFGTCLVIEERYPLAHQHGTMSLASALDARPEESAVLLARTPAERAALLAADPRRFVFLDTETTGLAGGTGTYAFLVGIARFGDNALIVRQFFMRALTEEHALLHLLAQELAECDVLVTYNGKAFDWPLLETRYAMGRRIGPSRPRDPSVHVDLLFASRRLWRARLESCSLGHVELHLLGVRRGHDTPGWLIPQLYFAYLRSGDGRPLAGVFRHNALDLLSLAALFGRVAALRGPAARPQGGVAPQPYCVHSADELLALGRGFEEAGDPERALACYRAAACGDGLAHAALRVLVVREAHLRAGTLLKRLRLHGEALSHWQTLLEMPLAGPIGDGVRPYEELAMYYEHTARDVLSARAHVCQALSLLASAGPGAARARARLLHRLARLDRLTPSAAAGDGLPLGRPGRAPDVAQS